MSKLDYDGPPWGTVESVAGPGGRVPAILGEPLEPLERVVLAGEDGPIPGRIHYQPGHRPALHVRLAGAGQGNLVLPWTGYRAARWVDFAAAAAEGVPLAEPDRWHRSPESMREALAEHVPPAAPGGDSGGPLAVRCDVCGAPPGAACVDGRGVELEPHAWRVAKAGELAEADEPPELEPTEDLAHPCESCGARPGEACTTSSGAETSPHAARRKLAEAARAAAALEDEDLEEPPGEELEDEDLEEPPGEELEDEDLEEPPGEDA